MFPDRKELRGRTEALRTGLRRAAERETSKAGASLRETLLRLAYVSPEKRISRLASESSLRRAGLTHALQLRLEAGAASCRTAETVLKTAAARRTEAAEAQTLRLREKLEAINPMQVLQRGYTLVTDRKGRILSGVQEARETGNVSIRFADGTADAVVTGDREFEYE